MRISKRTREQAALICAIAASGGVWRDGVAFDRWSFVYDHVAESADVAGPAVRVAVRAWMHVTRHGTPWTREVDAEAEALLMSGWSPP